MSLGQPCLESESQDNQGYTEEPCLVKQNKNEKLQITDTKRFCVLSSFLVTARRPRWKTRYELMLFNLKTQKEERLKQSWHKFRNRGGPTVKQTRQRLWEKSKSSFEEKPLENDKTFCSNENYHNANKPNKPAVCSLVNGKEASHSL